MKDYQIKRLIEQYSAPFTPEEFLDGRSNLTKKVIRATLQFRLWHGYKMQITSAYRSTGSHKYGSSIDALLWSKWQQKQPDPMEIWLTLTTWPWHGMGIYFDWNDGLGIHYDLVPYSFRKRPLRWLRVGGVYYYQSTVTGLFHHEDYPDITKDLETQILKYKARCSM